MDIAEIREKAKLLKDRKEELAAREEAPPIAETVVEPEKFDLPGHAETISEDISVPEIGGRPPKDLMDMEEESRVEEQIIKSWEQGLGNAMTEDPAPVYCDPQKPETYADEEPKNIEGEEAVDEEVEAIIFSLDNEDYGVDIHQVKEVIKVRELTSVPNAPKDIMGVISLRGVVIPVMNLRGRFGMPIKNSGERIIIVKDGAGLLGLLVDAVRHVVRVPEKSIESPPSINTIDGELIRGIGRYKGGMFILIDTQKMLELK